MLKGCHVRTFGPSAIVGSWAGSKSPHKIIRLWINAEVKRTSDYRELKCPISSGETNRDLTLIYGPIEYDEFSLFWHDIDTILRELIFVQSFVPVVIRKIRTTVHRIFVAGD
jgi:hypothetical protein